VPLPRPPLIFPSRIPVPIVPASPMPTAISQKRSTIVSTSPAETRKHHRFVSQKPSPDPPTSSISPIDPFTASQLTGSTPVSPIGISTPVPESTEGEIPKGCKVGSTPSHLNQLDLISIKFLGQLSPSPKCFIWCHQPRTSSLVQDYQAPARSWCRHQWTCTV